MTTTADTGWTLDLARWNRRADDAEIALLQDLAAPVLEVGCGPGRLVAELAALGRPALGIDVSPAAAEMSAAAGAPFLLASVFDPIPGEGRWPTVLILDGSIGIGGDPVALLARIRHLLAPNGFCVAEIEGPGRPRRRATAQLEAGPGITAWLPWASIGCDDVAMLAERGGLRVDRIQSRDDRWFAWLARV